MLYTIFLLASLGWQCQAFGPSLPSSVRQHKIRTNDYQTIHPNPTANFNSIDNPLQRISKQPYSSTSLNNGVIIDVPDDFFTIAFFSIGLFYSLGKAYNRYLLEEVAFEQRKLEARERRLESDPTLNELDLRREESAAWPSVYGRKYRGEGETVGGENDDGGRRSSSQQRSRVSTLDREDDEDEYNTAMTDDEIADFESTNGVEYDPYYDEPYEESELPVGKFKEDKSYGDRRYENGEVFYKDEGSGMFYRQGSRPRSKKFWDLNSS